MSIELEIRNEGDEIHGYNFFVERIISSRYLGYYLEKMDKIGGFGEDFFYSTKQVWNQIFMLQREWWNNWKGWEENIRFCSLVKGTGTVGKGWKRIFKIAV